ncbi:UNVERIFIED_CONTAM: hypothetical protein GTU68_057339 [Idotea baltica]|nr:hypothetical protein [Idotea baltica]
MYDPSENDLRFAIQNTIGLDQISHLDAFSDVSPDLVDAVLSEAAKIAREELAPCNNAGDIQGSKWNSDFSVTTPDGFKQAHNALAAGGWYGIEIAEEFGGQALPHLISAAVGEMFHSANMGFSLCHLLTQGLTHALTVSASQEQKEKFLPPMAEGRWTGTMNLTEPQAGTDLAAIKSTAVKEGDHYRIKGQKIFITYGEHDMAENIVHLVLARAEGAPDGVNGISVFIVPKFLVNDDGSLGERNDVKCVSIEHKLGINGSPTSVLQFGEDKGAIGYLVGEENQGLKIMFGMMNHARFGEGTTAIQANDLMFRKTLRDGGKGVNGLLAEIQSDANAASKHDDAKIANAAADVLRGVTTAQRAVEFILSNTLSTREAAAVGVPYLMMMGTLAGGWMSLKSAIAAKDNVRPWDQTFRIPKCAGAGFKTHPARGRKICRDHS